MYYLSFVEINAINRFEYNDPKIKLEPTIKDTGTSTDS